MKSLALALGAGGARGLSHIAVFEALDELGIKPVAIAGSSIGAVAGAVYGAGMSGKAIRRYVVDFAHNRPEVWRRLMLARAGTIRGMFNGNFAAAVRLDAEKLIAQFLPDVVPDDFAALGIPLTVVASNLYGRREVTFSSGPLKPALAASIAEDRKGLPNAIESLYATVLVMTSAIINEKLRREAPDLLVQPNVGTFRTLDFFQASAILRVAEATKTDLKAKLEALLGL